MSDDSKELWTVGRLLKWATDDFRTRGIEAPRLDAEVLLSHSLGLTRTEIFLQGDRPLDDAELQALRALIKRRRSHEPIAYLRGFREFYGRSFHVDARVLVPRPDTETLIDVALERTKQIPLSARTLDLCTGSGCVAITLAKARPTTKVFACDLSDDALVVARENALRLGAYNVAFHKADLFAGIAKVSRIPFDLVVANPPYIPSAECDTLMPDVRLFEPRMALDGGADGLDLVRRLVAGAPKVMRPQGVFALELMAGQAPVVAELFESHGFVDVRIAKDLGKIERVVSGVLKERPRRRPPGDLGPGAVA